MSDRDEPRRDWVSTPETATHVLDHCADIAKDAVDFEDVDADRAADALKAASVELREHAQEQEAGQ